MPDASELEAVMRYHERTKHHFNRLAAGPGELDWANQPDPFRRYALALSAWKQAGGAWSGAVHCLERVRGVALQPWAIFWKLSLPHGA